MSRGIKFKHNVTASAAAGAKKQESPVEDVEILKQEIAQYSTKIKRMLEDKDKAKKAAMIIEELLKQSAPKK
jgi:hypothetical protein